MMESDQPQEGLSDAQERILAILPMPSAILSIMGSSAILYMAVTTRQQRKWTPYTRLLMGLSICDIISSVSLGIAAFFRPRDGQRVWSFGNDATCSATGTLIQFSYSGLFYNGMLSFYFVMTVRSRLTNAYIAKHFEPLMHFVALGFPLVTAIIGAAMGVYSETASGMGCWVNDYPRGCGDEPGHEKCTSAGIGWWFFGLPYVFSLVSIVTNNLIIWIFVRQQRRPLRQKNRISEVAAATTPGSLAASMEGTAVANLEEDSPKSVFVETDTAIFKTRGQSQDDRPSSPQSHSHDTKWNTGDSVHHKHLPSQSQGQLQRLKLVSSQAFLFAATYSLCNTCLGLEGLTESIHSSDEELAMVNKMYPLMVLNAILAPVQGFLNLLVYMRPKYLKWKHEYPSETRLWAARRAIFGEDIHRSYNPSGPPQKTIDEPSPQIQTGNFTTNNASEQRTNGNEMGNNAAATRLPKSTVSSLTASHGEFDHVEETEDESWKGFQNEDRAVWAHMKKAAPMFRSSLNSRGSSLEIISELTESTFDPILRLKDNDDMDSDSIDMPPQSTPPLLSPKASESRWSSNSRSPPKGLINNASVSLDFSMPKRTANENEGNIDDVLTDSPIIVPMRKLSPNMPLDSISSFSPSSTVSLPEGEASPNSDSSVDTLIKAPVRRLSPLTSSMPELLPL